MVNKNTVLLTFLFVSVIGTFTVLLIINENNLHSFSQKKNDSSPNFDKNIENNNFKLNDDKIFRDIIDNIDTSRDIGVTILGYQLNNDGTPHKILKDRVSKGVEVFKMLKEDGKNPIFLVSGNGLNINENAIFKSEAQAMSYLLIKIHNIDPRDIVRESLSKNTMDNAINLVNIFKQTNLKKLVVVSSDFHLLRVQFMFQTIIPSEFQLDFYGSETSQKTDKQSWLNEPMFFLDSPASLKEKGYLEGNGTFGYQSIKNLPKWKMICREIDLDIINQRVYKNKNIIDYRSNQGYFSEKLSKKLLDFEIFSFIGGPENEFEIIKSGQSNFINISNINNHYQCEVDKSIDSLKLMKLNSLSYKFEYQLSLSQFHWFNINGSKLDFEEALVTQLLSSKTTFLELPETRIYDGITINQLQWKILNNWYENRSVETILSDIKLKYSINNMKWKVLGGNPHENGTIRKLFRIDIDNNISNNGNTTNHMIEILKEIYKCK